MNDLAGAVGRVLQGHVGQGWALKRGEILSLVRQLPAYQEATGQMVWEAIEDLREAGWMICSLMDDNYFLAGSPEEYQHFKEAYVSYALTILDRAKAMDRTAERHWGPAGLQERLF
ncbi:MAG: hypothetical protein IMZ50_02615 [Candidatus Atribacteria bacterium]|nr:hypothetical protein [Candidatus Atribacteria bacterium]